MRCAEHLPVLVVEDDEGGNVCKLGRAKAECRLLACEYPVCSRIWQAFSKLCDLDLGWWSAAWDQYLLAAVMLHQLTFEEALRHKKVRVPFVCVATRRICQRAGGTGCRSGGWRRGNASAASIGNPLRRNRA